MKRHFSEGCDDGSEFSGRGTKQSLIGASILKEVFKGPWSKEFTSIVEPFIKKVVHEEVERAISSSLRSSLAQPEPSKVKAWQLHFENKFPSTLFTSSRIESEDSRPVKIVLQDANSKKIITSGPLSSSKIEIVVLDGEFGADDREEWTDNEFSAKIVREREGKRPLVTGDLVITLRDGVGYLNEVSFSDNSSWLRSRKFRLGARVQNHSSAGRVREAISEAFVVKDHRGESYRKHHPPHLGDEVWRLERISKDGAFHTRLAKHEISTVKDFLRLYFTDPNWLRNILGRISNKAWETIVGHARDCIVDDDKLFLYHPLDKLEGLQTLVVEDIKRHACKNLNDMVPIDDVSIIGKPMLLPSSQGDPFSSSGFSLQNLNLPVAGQDQQEMQLGSCQIATSPTYVHEVGSSSQLDFSKAQNYPPLQVWSPSLRNSFITRDSVYEPFVGGYNWDSNGSLGTVALEGSLSTDDNSLEVDGSMWHESGLFLAPSNQALDNVSSNHGFQVSGNGSPRARWRKIRAAITWGISVRRAVAAKRRARLLYF